MQKTNNTMIGFFERPIEELPESKTIKDILSEKEDIGKYFTPVKCVFKRSRFEGKDGTVTDWRYTLKVSLHPCIEETVTKKECSLVNQVEFGFLCLEFLKPIDVNEIAFTGYIRYLRGISDSVKIKSEDKSFIHCELFISENLAPLRFFLNNGSAKFVNRLTKLTPQELVQIHAERFVGKQFRLTQKAVQEIEETLDSDNANQ